MDIKNILIPIDFSENSSKILQQGGEFAKKLGARLSVVFVVQSFEDYSGFFVPHIPIVQFQEELLKSAQDKMRAFINETPEKSLVDKTTVLEGDIAEELILFAKTEAVDMIIMGTHGYKGLEKILFGSVAEKIVKLAPCPVLTINPYH